MIERIRVFKKGVFLVCNCELYFTEDVLVHNIDEDIVGASAQSVHYPY